jgi:Na+/H+-dicarboxylate symporter
MTFLFRQPLWLRILVSMVLGVILGFGIRPDGYLDGLIDGEAWSAALKLMGDAFIRLIRMLSVPLIFVSVAAAVVSIGDLSRLGTSGARTLRFCCSQAQGLSRLLA